MNFQQQVPVSQKKIAGKHLKSLRKRVATTQATWGKGIRGKSEAQEKKGTRVKKEGGS